VLPGRRTPWAGIVFTTLIALALITVVTYQAESSIVVALGGTTGLLLLVVFTIVNIACLVLRQDQRATPKFRAPTAIPVIGALGSAFLVGPWARDPEDYVQYKIAAGLLALGIVLWVLTWMTNRGVRAKRTGFRDPEHIEH
jgi:amino acid transporter